MSWIARYLRLPASEPQKNIVIAFCVIAMSIMSIGLVWQAQIIASQREAIRWLASAAKYGGESPTRPKKRAPLWFGGFPGGSLPISPFSPRFFFDLFPGL